MSYLSRARAAVCGIALLVLGALPALADTIQVPGDVADLQDAINGASSGDVIVVAGGVWETIVIDRALTIMGDPAPMFSGPTSGIGFVAPSPITLQGPGSGVVILANVQVGGTVNGFLYQDAGSGVSGGGFDALYVYDSSIAAPFIPPVTPVPTFGRPGIAVSLPYMWLERTSVSASDQFPSDALCQPSPGDAAAGLVAPDATVVLLDSSVRGGKFAFTLTPCAATCPAVCPFGGRGGTGIVCDTLFESNSILLGGAGATWMLSMGAFCCFAEDGTAANVNLRVTLQDRLSLSGPPMEGQPLTISWSSSDSSVALLLSVEAPTVPMYLFGLGFLFFDPFTLVSFGPFPPVGNVVLNVPSGFAGFVLGFQVLGSSTNTLSRPVSGVVLQ